MKKYSTENLYLCQLGKLEKITFPDFDTTRRTWCKTSKYILAKGEYYRSYKRYVDVFNGTLYRDIGEIYTSGEYFVLEAIPCITNLKYMTEEQLIEILKVKNPTFFEIEKEETVGKKFMRTLTRRNNKE